ncbi:hypothetical protein NQ318_022306 [Aromia moschata]|uniref:Uncharacterized protein n=1 Tax=Aromia moschata TaxID=1265417 RepID=A0AAV8Z6H2_9CUCU|nr:hypothetical protein NQ318_022306 [Aromia moschata]
MSEDNEGNSGLQKNDEVLLHNIKNQWGRLISCLTQLDSVDLVEPTLKLGRSDECDIVIYKSKFLPNQLFFVSKEHFLISRDPDDPYISYITDLSKNGTYLNGTLIGKNLRVVLQNNDSIAIGEKLKVYIFKSMTYSVNENYLPLCLRMRYEPSRLLGKGGCGEVRLAYEKFTCKKYAIKKISKGRNTPSQIHNVNHPTRIHTEISILQKLSHPLVVNMREIVETEEEVFIVLEYVKGGELTNKISPLNPLTEASTKFLFYQMVLAVHYLHSNGITHRDLKPGNVLLATNNTQSLIKVTDFGLSKVTEDYDTMRTVCGTWHYIAPEVLNPGITEYDNQVDVWSLGVILFYMLSNELPFQSADKSTLGKLIVTGTYKMQGQVWAEVSEAARDLVKRMLVVNPHKRITVTEILNHPWILKDNLMRFRVENLMGKSEDDNEENSKRRVPSAENGFTRGIKRARLDLTNQA